jgi:hypothetical protein
MVEAVDLGARGGGVSNLSLSLDKATGKSGDVRHLKISVLQPDTNGKGYETVALYSTQGATTYKTFLTIINP